MENKKPALFSDEELKKLKLSPVELATLEAADAFCDVADMLPDDEKEIDAFFEKIDKVFPNDFKGAFEMMGVVAQKDPKFFGQLVAMTNLLNDVQENKGKAKNVNQNLVRQASESKTFATVKKVLDDKQ